MLDKQKLAFLRDYLSDMYADGHLTHRQFSAWRMFFLESEQLSDAGGRDLDLQHYDTEAMLGGLAAMVKLAEVHYAKKLAS